jgi:glucose/arabinose dehydrogenase
MPRGGSARGPNGLVVAVTAALLLAACSTAGEAPTTSSPSGSAEPVTTTTASSASPAPDLAAVRVDIKRVATLEQPVALAVRSDDPALYIAEKTGRVRAVLDGEVAPHPVLDLSSEVSLGGEQGLLGLAFAPGGRFLYVNYTDTNGDTHVTEFAMSGGRADPATRRDVLFVEQPYSNHNGGNLVFGPDGYLYIGLGDGGSGGDPHDNAQRLSVLLGKMLRISPRPSGGEPYGVPADNPFVDRPDVRPEIWAYGLRNPWRYSFDRLTGDLWIGDVGQSAWEEVSVQPGDSPGGENYGWNRLEGSHPYEGAEPPRNAVDPVFEYGRGGGGCVVTGGYVYRGQDIPDLIGAYVFADFCIGRLEALRLRNGRVTDHELLDPSVPNITSFGEDAQGELYAMSLDGGVYRLVPDR